MAGVLVTRPAPEGEILARHLRAAGHRAWTDPLLTIRFLDDGMPLDLTGVQALVFTSANGVRAAAGRTGVRALPVWTVGAKTAAAAQEAGFTDVRQAGGDGAALASLLAGAVDPGRGRLLHIGGAELAVDIAAALAPRGITVDRVVGYEAVAAEQMAQGTLVALDQGGIDHILLFSPRTARTVVGLLHRHGRAGHLSSLTGCCLSPAVAAAAGPGWAALPVADRREEAAVLDLLPTVLPP
ncbi:MAG: uroporphyrinogen-III synthase [Pseudomonadota bacterium]|jgi:uroporphyrinogen-III synthase